MHGSRSKTPAKSLVRQRCAEGFNSGVKVVNYKVPLRRAFGFVIPNKYHCLEVGRSRKLWDDCESGAVSCCVASNSPEWYKNRSLFPLPISEGEVEFVTE
jgi:hypothetical protein